MEDAVFNKLLLLIMVIAVITLVIYQQMAQRPGVETLKESTGCPACPVCPVCPSCTNTDNNTSTKKNIVIDVNQSDTVVPPLVDPVREYDYRAFSDPLVPPYKRDDYQVPLPAIATRGYPSSFKKLGLLIDDSAENTDQYKFMSLMGRQKYPGSNFYDYYVTENKQDSPLKFDLPNLHKELYTDDTVVVSELGKTYKVKIDRNLGFDYYPFIY